MTEHAAFRFVPMSAADVKAVAQLDADVFGADAWGEEDFAEVFADPTHTWHVVKSHDQLAAYCLLAVADGNMSLESICTAKSMQGRGLGKMLMIKTIQQALELGCDSITLEVHENNSGAQKLYYAFGFAAAGLTDEPYYADGGKALNMKLDLAKVDRSKFTGQRVVELLELLKSGSRAA